MEINILGRSQIRCNLSFLSCLQSRQVVERFAMAAFLDSLYQRFIFNSNRVVDPSLNGAWKPHTLRSNSSHAQRTWSLSSNTPETWKGFCLISAIKILFVKAFKDPYYSFTIFRRCWLAPIPWLLALTILERYQHCHRFDGIFDFIKNWIIG